MSEKAISVMIQIIDVFNKELTRVSKDSVVDMQRRHDLSELIRLLNKELVFIKSIGEQS